jgi:hypothetical protein
VRGEDIACRFGGEEFVVILPKASLADTQLRAEALRKGIKAQPPGEPSPLYPTATMSLGVAAYPEHGTSVAQLIAAAITCTAKTPPRLSSAVGGEGRPIEVLGQLRHLVGAAAGVPRPRADSAGRGDRARELRAGTAASAGRWRTRRREATLTRGRGSTDSRPSDRSGRFWRSSASTDDFIASRERRSSSDT